ncbi:hypothetical protein NQ318_008548 [Aromia moschata]|uniref:Uncharacterized protein n=1 Tax=Aromia moschata TaxID=1265417 RepID=A0AAV8YXC8_9CUCU|nr:hypothetical protein NQ318_008548 [Aromia moschata]
MQQFFVTVVVLASVGLVLGAGLTPEQKEKLSGHHKACLAETGVDSDLVTKARKGEFSEDPKLKEHIFCVAKKIGFVNDAGDFQKDVMKTKISAVLGDEALAEKYIAECAVSKGTPQETAFQAIKCYYEKSRKSVV